MLFDGKLGDQWLELSTSGGDYSKFAQIKDEMLVVDVPAGNSWGKTGIRSAETLFKIPAESENKAVKLTFNIKTLNNLQVLSLPLFQQTGMEF